MPKVIAAIRPLQAIQMVIALVHRAKTEPVHGPLASTAVTFALAVALLCLFYLVPNT